LRLSCKAPRKFEPLGGEATRGELQIGARRCDLCVDFMLFLPQGEKLERGPTRLGLAEPKEAAWFEGIVENRNDSLLQSRTEINEDIATGDDVELRKWRIARDVVSRD